MSKEKKLSTKYLVIKLPRKVKVIGVECSTLLFYVIPGQHMDDTFVQLPTDFIWKVVGTFKKKKLFVVLKRL